MTSRVLSKISNLARQIERTNLEFLETKILDRAAILNITTGPERQEEANAANATQTEHKPEQQIEANRQTNDAPTNPDGLFSLCKGGTFHRLGIFYMLCLQTTDHLGLVRGPDPSGPDPFDWAASFSEFFNERLGYSKP